MMLDPSIDMLLEKVDSKYTLITIAAKRARELQENAPLMIDDSTSNKYVGRALEEIKGGMLKPKE